MNLTYGVIAMVAVAIATLAIGTYGLRVSRTTSDFYVASRSVSAWWNASAISGEYISAASFLGVAGLVFAYGADMLWYSIGYTVGYLILLVLVAAPMRRSGAYTLPDFADVRLRSMPVRQIASVLAIGIGWLYLLPQLQGAGLTMHTITGGPPWVGALVVAIVVIANVIAGGMRSITFVQAFQYWFKLTALIVPAAFLIVAWRAQGAPTEGGPNPLLFQRPTTVTMVSAQTIRVDMTEPVLVTGTVDGRAYLGRSVPLSVGTHDIKAGTELTFATGQPVPHEVSLPSQTDSQWAQLLSGAQQHPLYTTYALIIATFLGTMGLPHVVVRFYTNPNGRAARRTTVNVLALLGSFYLLPPIFALLGRLYVPDMLITGQTDTVVLLLPGRLVGGTAGELLGALLAAGAFAAFLSTSCGLTMALAGVLSQGVLRPVRKLGSIRSLRMAAMLAVAVPLIPAVWAPQLSVATEVGLAFAVAASSFCPLLVLGIWWRGLTWIGAAAGMVAGGGLALVAGAMTIGGVVNEGWWHTLLAWPAAWSTPIGFGVMVLVSRLTARHVVSDVDQIMAQLHLPESDQPARGLT